MHGYESWTADEAVLWKAELDRRGWRLLSLQWWFGQAPGSFKDYRALRTRQLKAGGAILHGFSMGSAKSYALAGHGPQGDHGGFHRRPPKYARSFELLPEIRLVAGWPTQGFTLVWRKR